MFYTIINKIKVFNNREGFLDWLSLNRTEYSPHGVCDIDVYDTTGNIQVDYTLFGYENIV
ncbi:MAG: hypothetical protein LBB64_07535 [Dysgonamonadaceae bacterium]|jgi:hypothetical protein|nr:hypothetical protein [Dysgonamonadaceae bacterium]